MPKLVYRKIYDDEGEEMREGSMVLVNGYYPRILYFDSDDKIQLEDFLWEDVFSITKMPEDRYGDLDIGSFEGS